MLKPLERMWERIEIARDHSDTDYFNALMYTGEMLTKLAVGGMVAAIANDQDRHRYRQLYILVRANGIGDWARVLDDTLTGPAAQYLYDEAREEQRELTKNCGEMTWQYDSVKELSECLRIIESSSELLGQKIQARLWFSLFARLRNSTRGHGASTADQLAQICPSLENSIELFACNFMLFQRPWVYLYKSLSGKYRVTKWVEDIGPLEMLKAQYGKRYNFSNGVYIHFDGSEKYSALARVDLVESDPESIDFFFGNGGFTDQRFEMLSYTSGDKKHANSSPYLMPITALPSSETQGLNYLEARENSFSTLPPLQREYVTRQKLEHELYRELTEADQHRIITLVGRGGIGKTWLALSVLHQLTETDNFTAIFWFSARDIDLRPDGPKQVRPHVLTENDIAREFCQLVLSPDQYDARGFDALAYLNENLQESQIGPLLFVFDNFETVRNPLELYTWLDTYLRPPNKALITTRLRVFRGDYPIEVSGMAEEEAQLLIDKTAGALGILRLLSNEYRHQLFEESDGHPYIIKILLGEVAKTRQARKPERIVASQDKILDALFERTYSGLSPAAQRVFLTLCNWRSVVPLLAVQAILIKPTGERIDVEGAIEELQKSSFIELIESDADDELFIHVPLVASIFGERKLAVNPLGSAIESDTELLRYVGATQPAHIKEGIKPRIERLFRNIHDNVADNRATLEEFLPMIEFIAAKYPPAWLLLADLYIELGALDRFEAAKSAVRRSLENPERVENPWKVWQMLAELCLRTSDYLGEVHALVKMCQLPDTWFPHISNTVNKINNYLKSGLIEPDLFERRALVEPLIEIMRTRIDAEGDATDRSRLAWLYMNLQDQAAARVHVQIGLELEPGNDHCLKLAESLYR